MSRVHALVIMMLSIKHWEKVFPRKHNVQWTVDQYESKMWKKIDNSKLALAGPFKLECLLMRYASNLCTYLNDLAAFQIKFCARCTHHLLQRTLLLCTCIFYPQQSSSSLGSYTLTYYFLRILKMKRKRGEKVFLSRESSVDKQRDMTISGK